MAPHITEVSSTAKSAPATTAEAPAQSSSHQETPDTYPEALIHHPDPDDASNFDGLISIDSNTDDDDSAIGDLSLPGSTMSVRSSVYDYIEENGRRYHRYKEGSYVFPNDEREQERLDMQHHLFYLTLHEAQFVAPIGENPQEVLDIGTGTGIWAIDFASKYPSANVIGNDLSPIQPEFVPSNCSFEVEDVEDEWTYSQRFDFIHWRLMLSCFKDPRYVIAQAFKSLAPGGYMEMKDADWPFKCVDKSLQGTALEAWTNYIVDSSKKAGRPWTRVHMYKQWMEEIGFVDIEEKLYQWPINTWPRDPHLKTLGHWFQHDLLEALDGLKKLFINVLGWTPEALEVFLVQVRKDIMNRKIHAYVVLRVIYGRKPPLNKPPPHQASPGPDEVAI